MKKYDFICKKCKHILTIDDMNKIELLSNYDCPECGEEGYQNWIYDGLTPIELT